MQKPLSLTKRDCLRSGSGVVAGAGVASGAGAGVASGAGAVAGALLPKPSS